jgi:uncharacterized protein YlaI
MCVICGEQAAVEASGGIKLCTAHARLPRTTCRNCSKIISIGDTTIADKVTYNAPSSIVLCSDCDNLAKTNCGACNKILNVGNKTVNAKVTYDPPSDLVLCQACDTLPQVNCAKCQRVGLVNGHTVRDIRRAVVQVHLYPDEDNMVFILCAACTRESEFKCRACGIPAGYSDGGQSLTLPGATFITPENDRTNIIGWRCAICSVGALRNTAAAQGAYDAAVMWMTNWLRRCGRDYPAYGNRLKWSIDRDNEFEIDDDGMELGHCETTPRGGGPDSTHKIQVLYFMRPLSFQQTMLHELTHALTNHLKIGNKPLIEGFCNYVAYLYLKEVSETANSPADRAEALRAIARMEANDDPVYGQGFRDVRDELVNTPNRAITWLAGTGTPTALT